MDKVDTETRSRIMSRVKGKNTKPELRVRRLTHGLGYRYRLHARELPGTPDIVFRKRKKAIFVHGCFWHAHDVDICRRGARPTSKQDFWNPKLDANVARDEKNEKALHAMGYEVLVVWECQLKDETALTGIIRRFLEGV